MGIYQRQNPRDNGLIFEDSQFSREILRLSPMYGPTLGHSAYFRHFDDFVGDTLEAGWSGAVGSDPQGVAPTITGAANGVVRLTSGDAGTGTAADASSLTQALNWYANQGGLFMETRLKLVSSVANVCVNVGFTDVLATTTLEMPFTINGTTITSNASDAACFVFDTAQTNDFFHLQGVKANTDTAINNSAVAPVADTYIVLRIELDSSGNATFYINNVSYGSVANAVTAATALTPIIAVETRTTATKSVDVDYVLLGQLR